MHEKGGVLCLKNLLEGKVVPLGWEAPLKAETGGQERDAYAPSQAAPGVLLPQNLIRRPLTQPSTWRAAGDAAGSDPAGGGHRGVGGPEGDLTVDRGLLPAWGGDRDPGGSHGEGQVRLVVGSAL